MLKVMIVDNESAIRKGLVHCIHWGDLGCEIAAQADDGMMALEQIPVIQPNIVISDIRMPGMDGLELAEIIARDHPGIKVIILTGYPDFAYAQRAIQYHVVDFVLKPMTVENLTNAIEKAKAAIAEDRSSQDLQEKLSTTSARNMELQQSMLLHDLIHRVACSQLYVLNRLAQLKMDLRSYFVLKLHITSLSEEALTEEEYNEYLNQSQEILSDCLSSYQHYYIARGTQDCFVVICAAGEAPITALCREAVNIVGSLAHFLLFIGISNCNDNPICLADAADEAAQAVRFTVFTPDHPVTFGPFGDKGKKLIKCRREFRCIQIGYGQIPAEVFGKGTDTDVEWNIMKQKFGKYSDAKALFHHFNRGIVFIDPKSYVRRDMV